MHNPQQERNMPPRAKKSIQSSISHVISEKDMVNDIKEIYNVLDKAPNHGDESFIEEYDNPSIMRKYTYDGTIKEWVYIEKVTKREVDKEDVEVKHDREEVCDDNSSNASNASSSCKKPKPKAAKQETLDSILKLLEAGEVDRGITSLRSFIEKSRDEPCNATKEKKPRKQTEYSTFLSNKMKELSTEYKNTKTPKEIMKIAVEMFRQQKQSVSK